MFITVRPAMLALLSVAAWTPHAWGSAASVYIANAAAGAADGSSCANARAYTFFNSSGDWGSGSAQIGPGTTVHLCGVFNAPAGASGYLNFQGSGTSTAPISLVAESGAILQAPYWGASGAISADGVSNIIMDGQGNGLIQATANGTLLANQAPNCNGNCTAGIYLLECNSCTVRNWTVANIYVNTPPSDESNAAEGSSGIFFNSGNNAVISGNTVHDTKWCIVYGFAPGATLQNVTISGNTAYNCDHGIFVTSDDSGSNLSGLYVNGNTIHDAVNWDDTLNYNHHDGIHISPSQANTSIANVFVYNNYIYGDWGANCNSFIFMESDASNQAITGAGAFNNLEVNTSTTHTCGNGLLQDYGGQNMLIANNTLIGSTKSNGTGLILEEYGSFKPVVKNNIVSMLQNGMYVSQSASLPVSDYNDFYNLGNVMFEWGTNCCTSLGNWQGQSGSPDAHSTTGNPELNSSYVPQVGGAASLAGTNLTSVGWSALDADRSGVARSATGPWDIGAYSSGAVDPPITVTVNPATISLGPGAQQQFGATVTGSTNGVTWSLSPSVGTLSTSGLYVAPASITTQQTVTITAKSVDNPAITGTATVTLTPPAPVSITVAPSTISLGPGAQQQFTANVTGSSATVTWSVSPNVGTVSASGNYTAPASITTVQTVQVVATVGANLASAAATITLDPPVSNLTVTPGTVTLGPGQRQTFSVSGQANATGTVWSLSPQMGTISASGMYTAPKSIKSTRTITVTAKHTTNPAISGSAVITLSPK